VEGHYSLVRWEDVYQEIEARWLRWATLAGVLLPTPQETAVAAQRQAVALEALLARYRTRCGALPAADRQGQGFRN